MRTRLFDLLRETGGMSMPLWPDSGRQDNLRNPGRSHAADFPPELMPPPRTP